MNLISGQYRVAPMGEGSSWLLVGGSEEKKLGDILSVGITDRVEQNGQTLSDVWLKRCEDLAARILPSGEDHGINRLFLPGFRLFDLDEASWKKRGWDIEDYLPQCGISSTASAFGLARAFLTKKSALVVHGNHHASGRQALVAAVTK
jgi:hypothetical protein